MQATDAAALLVIAAVVGWYVYNNYVEVAAVRSRVDGRTYVVMRSPHAQESADTLARLNAKLMALIEYVNAVRPEDDVSRRIKEYYAPGNLSEASGRNGYTSYTVDKRRVSMCLRVRDDSGGFVDDNTLMYVAVHELAHIGNTERDHTPRFWSIFRRLLSDAADAKLYERVDYSKRPVKYCGMQLNSSVLFS